MIRPTKNTFPGKLNAESFYRHRLLRFLTFFSSVFFSLFILFLPFLFASEFSSVNQKSINPFETVYSESSRGLGFQIVGESLLEAKKIKKTSRVPLQVSGSVKKAFLLWTGEVKEQNPNTEKIRFLGPKGQKHPVTAQHIWKKNSTGILYSALADVTPYVRGSGHYGVSHVASDVVNPGGKDPYSVAGWALLVVTQDWKSDKFNSITFLAGLEVLKPGETYNFSLIHHLPENFEQPKAIGIIGGHGRAGNGSGNLLNNRALSGKDDWDGSAGKFWDIDLFQVNPDNKSITLKREMTLTIDPLLQWLYPVGVILELRVPDKNGK